VLSGLGSIGIRDVKSGNIRSILIDAETVEQQAITFSAA
jgi:hypothetical protein